VWTNGNNVDPAPRDNAQPAGFQPASAIKEVADDLPF